MIDALITILVIVAGIAALTYGTDLVIYIAGVLLGGWAMYGADL